MNELINNPMTHNHQPPNCPNCKEGDGWVCERCKRHYDWIQGRCVYCPPETLHAESYWREKIAGEIKENFWAGIVKGQNDCSCEEGSDPCYFCGAKDYTGIAVGIASGNHNASIEA